MTHTDARIERSAPLAAELREGGRTLVESAYERLRLGILHGDFEPGARLSIELRTAHATDTSTVEERVRGVLRQPLIVDGVEVVPAGAAVSGAITETERAGKVKGRAHLALRFTSITVDDADLRVTTDRIARDAESTKKEDAAKIGIGAGAGAIVGAITGGKKGAAVGGAIGAGAGTGVVLATRGDEVRLDAGTVLSTTLREPLVVRQRVR